MFRPRALEDFPLYFFFSSCQLVKGLGIHSLDWVSLGERRQGSFETEPFRSRAFPELPLLNSSHRPIFKYAYHVQLRTEKNWREPILHAKLPRLPDLHATPEEKGTYALFLMLLFRPHRDVSEIARASKVGQAASPQTCSKDKSDDAAWTAVYDEFVRWRTHEIDAIAATYFKKSQSETLPEPRLHFNRENPGRRTWWACMISEKLRSYDTASRLHKVEASLPPQDLAALPVYEYTMSDEAGHTPPPPDLNQSNDESQGSRHGLPSEDEDRIQGPEATKQRCAPTSTPLASHCGNLPAGYSLEHFHAPPSKVHARNAEGRYWQEFASQMHRSLSSQEEQDVSLALPPDCTIDSADAVDAAERQQSFFKAVDGFQLEGMDGTHEKPKATNFDKKLHRAVQTLPAMSPHTPTIVMKAAYTLLLEGLLNIPDVNIINVKQARAFLWNAAWLQEYTNGKWRLDGSFASSSTSVSPCLQQFVLAIVGPGGTGKTAVVKSIEALTTYFAGPDTVRKLAPSNAAARLLQGDTLHSLFKLPFGQAPLSSKRGRLTKTALTRHRRQWTSKQLILMRSR